MAEKTVAELKKELQEAKEKLQKEEALNKELSGQLDSLKEAYEKEAKENSEGTEFVNIEAALKNEAYAFIISNGLLDKFITFKIGRDTEPTEAALKHLILTAEAYGDWIALL